MNNKIKKILLTLLAFVLIINIDIYKPFANKPVLEVHYIDVGHGDSIYIKTPNGDDILIDGGYANYEDDIEDTVVGYLKELNVDDIEVMIATHPHLDHMCGLISVLQEFKVESVYAPNIPYELYATTTYNDFLEAVEDEGLTINTAEANVEIPLKFVKAEFVGPIHDYFGGNINNSSAVLKLSYKKNSFLFAGDALIESEYEMIATGIDLTADVLKVGHHGRDDATSQEFLEAVNPKFAVISAWGIYSDSEEVLSTLNNYGVEVLTTYDNGNITAISDGKTITWEYPEF